ncbi:MAG: MBL fold metallo-hydrolase [Bdellovibrionaceae bacterium]|nr:MBL fold metallo-hydrolase [Pseudobdellovibrionaceae bacterium]|tara:strand:- start:372 stop:1343 length:972 start_codon:yes stop_codon:yes gene_type:complete
MSLRIKIWGARGSLPTPHLPSELNQRFTHLMHDFFESGYKKKSDVQTFLEGLPLYKLGGYGGNSPCIEVNSDRDQMIIDGGSGIRLLGYQLMNGPCGKGKGEVHLFFTHFHWDHLIGLPFFTPLFIPGNKIHVYSVQKDLPEVFQTIFKKPYFPVSIDSLEADIIYHQLEPRKPLKFGDMVITPYQLDHPDPCWGYRVESGGKVYSHCVDTEATRISEKELGLDLPLYQNVDLMLFDAQYTLMETIEKINWGHATASIGLDIAIREKIKKVLFMHHDPASSDEKIAAAEAEARRYYQIQKKAEESGFFEVDWSFAFEGQEIEL